MKIIKKHTRPKKIFNKLLFTSSLTIIATVSVLIVMITTYYSEVIIQSEMNMTADSLERANDYYIEKDKEVTRMIRELYSDTKLVNDLSYALHNNYEEYFKYRLNRYTDSPDFSPSNFNSFFNSFFNHDNEVVAFTLQSDASPSMEYQFIYDYSHWNSSIAQGLPKNPTSCTLENMQYEDTFMISRTMNNPGTFTDMGCLIIYYSTEELNHIFRKDTDDTNSIKLLLDENDEILYTTNKDVPKGLIQKVSEDYDDSIRWDGDTYYVKKLIGKNNYSYIGIIPKSDLNKLTVVKGTMWLLIGFFTLTAIFITYSFMRNYSARIDHIDGTIREVEKGNLDIRIRNFKQRDELTTISESFNAMLDELNNYIDRFYVANIKQQQAELKALQSQINPHFLFNTLEVIRMAAVIEGSDTASKMIYHLSRLFRYTLESKELVPFHVELEHTNQYLQLMKLHHPNKLHVMIDIPENVENLAIQKLMLQPLIENYIIHGFDKDRNDNLLKIIAVEDDHRLKLQVIDNGRGISDRRLREIMTHLTDEENIMQSIGLKNVHQRVRLKYGQDYGLTIQSEKGVETIVTIHLPLEGEDYDV